MKSSGVWFLRSDTYKRSNSYDIGTIPFKAKDKSSRDFLTFLNNRLNFSISYFNTVVNEGNKLVSSSLINRSSKPS